MRQILILFLTVGIIITVVLAIPGQLSGQVATPDAGADPAANEALVRRFFEIANSGDLEALADVHAPDFVIRTTPPGEDPGLSGLILNLSLAREGLPDLTFEIEDLIVEGNVAVARTTIRGTNLGEFFGNPPTGRAVETRAIDLWHIEDGKLAENWHVEDFLAVMRQIGTIPGGGPATPAASAPPAAEVSPSAADPATIEANKALAQAFHDEIFNQSIFDSAEELLAADFTWHRDSAAGVDELTSFAGAIREAFPDLEVSVDQVVAASDRVAILWTLSGTHQGDYFGAPATGNAVSSPGIDIYRIENGRIAEVWTVSDELGLLLQLGAFPPAE